MAEANADRHRVRGLLSQRDASGERRIRVFEPSRAGWRGRAASGPLGTSLSETIFDAGLRRATVRQYIAIYNADVAGYRQTVLTAFQQVEDSLAAVRIISQRNSRTAGGGSAQTISRWKRLAMRRASIPTSTC